MKLFLASLIYLMIAAVLGTGIYLAATGKPVFLIAGFLVFVFAFGKIGCKSH